MVHAGKGLAAVSVRVCLKLWVNPLRLKESMVTSNGFTSAWLAVHTATRAGLRRSDGDMCCTCERRPVKWKAAQSAQAPVQPGLLLTFNTMTTNMLRF